MTELLEKVKLVDQIISYLNSLSAKELNDLGVSDITLSIIKAERVYTMKELIYLAQDKCSTLDKEAKAFKEQSSSLCSLTLKY